MSFRRRSLALHALWGSAPKHVNCPCIITKDEALRGNLANCGICTETRVALPRHSFPVARVVICQALSTVTFVCAAGGEPEDSPSCVGCGKSGGTKPRFSWDLYNFFVRLLVKYRHGS